LSYWFSTDRKIKINFPNSAPSDICLFPCRSIPHGAPLGKLVFNFADGVSVFSNGNYTVKEIHVSTSACSLKLSQYPCRLTLLLGPPGCGKSTLLRALAGQLDKSLKVQKVIFFLRSTKSDIGAKCMPTPLTASVSLLANYKPLR